MTGVSSSGVLYARSRETIMRQFFALCVVIAFGIATAGCEKKTEIKKTTTTTTSTPEGSTTETVTTTVDTSGENPPAIPK
jgi:hypothetical protein